MNIIKKLDDKKFGVEIECIIERRKSTFIRRMNDAGLYCVDYGYSHTVLPGTWKIVSDSSIEYGGKPGTAIEVVSPPLKGVEGERQLKKVCQVLSDCRARVNKSCGLHIHIDANGTVEKSTMGAKDFKRLMFFYAKFEKVFDSMVPFSRRENRCNYARSLESTIRYIRSLKTCKKLLRSLPTRMCKVNLLAFVRYGTIEFRQHSGSIEYEKIINWINICKAVFQNMYDNRTTKGWMDCPPDYWMSSENNESTIGEFLGELKNYLSSETVRYIMKRIKHFAEEGN